MRPLLLTVFSIAFLIGQAFSLPAQETPPAATDPAAPSTAEPPKVEEPKVEPLKVDPPATPAAEPAKPAEPPAPATPDAAAKKSDGPREIYLPFKFLKGIFDSQGASVVVPLEEYQRLKAAADKPPAVAPEIGRASCRERV